MTQYFDSANRRLIFVQQTPSPEYWDSHWQADRSIHRQISTVKETLVSRWTRRYLKPGDSPIIEGGCGRGQHVAALTKNGYRCIGIDSAPETVASLNQHIPELDIRLGDVRCLEFADASCAAYWSLGVIEHFWDGYQSIGTEIQRVLRPDGYLFITFPSMSPLRRWKARLGCYPSWNGGGMPPGFYQFALQPRQVIQDFRSWGFELVKSRPLDGLKGLKDEVAAVRKPLQALFDYRGRSLALRALRAGLTRGLAAISGHATLLVLRKKAVP